MSPFPPTDQLAALLPLALAAGLDLPLTLLLLGSATSLGFQSAPPGELGDLAVPLVLGMAALFWLLELWAERRWLSALGWNLAQGLVRPLAAALLALLLIPDAGAPWRYGAALVAALVSLWMQAGRTGWRLLLDLAMASRPSRILVSAAEDAAALALVALLLDAPLAATVLSVVMMALGAAWARPAVRAYRFGLRLVWGGTWGILAPRRWSEPDRFPRWVKRALSSDELGPGGWTPWDASRRTRSPRSGGLPRGVGRGARGLPVVPLSPGALDSLSRARWLAGHPCGPCPDPQPRGTPGPSGAYLRSLLSLGRTRAGGSRSRIPSLTWTYAVVRGNCNLVMPGRFRPGTPQPAFHRTRQQETFDSGNRGLYLS